MAGLSLRLWGFFPLTFFLLLRFFFLNKINTPKQQQTIAVVFFPRSIFTTHIFSLFLVYMYVHVHIHIHVRVLIGVHTSVYLLGNLQGSVGSSLAVSAFSQRAGLAVCLLCCLNLKLIGQD